MPERTQMSERTQLSQEGTDTHSILLVVESRFCLKSKAIHLFAGQV